MTAYRDQGRSRPTRKILVGVIGPGTASDRESGNAGELGRLIAAKGWVLLSGGRDAGVMAAGNAGAHAAGGLTVGILPDESGSVSPEVDVVIRTGLGSARNNIIALSASVIVACGKGAGTSSEIALGIKAGTPVILLDMDDLAFEYFSGLDSALVSRARTPADAITMIESLLSSSGRVA